MIVNFGGFIPLSTVDWPGYSACVVFFRGCPNCCPDCHNPTLRVGHTPIGLGDLLKMIETSAPFISGIVFSGGEPTFQPRELLLLSEICKKDLGLKVCLHTSGVYPDALKSLLHQGSVDKIALDIKDSWPNYSKYLPDTLKVNEVKRSAYLCSLAFGPKKTLPEFEEVFTVFQSNLESIAPVAAFSPKYVPLVVQQGVPRDGRVPPLTRSYLTHRCKELVRFKDPGLIRLRTREHSEEIIHG